MTDAVPQPEPSDLEAAMRQHIADHPEPRGRLARIDLFHAIFAPHEESPSRPTAW
jgi:hypothetical protein